MKKHGIHIIADLYGCKFTKIEKLNINTIKHTFSKIIKNAGLTELGNYYHYFNKNAFTAVIALSESHLTIHSWPGFVA